MITTRHWMRRSLEEMLWPFELHDGAQAVTVVTANAAQWEEIRRHGVLTIVPVCCGPAAPLPDRWERRA